MRPTNEHIDTVCRPGCGASSCAFLMFGGGFECAKGGEFELFIRRRLADETMTAQGDNCSGPPDFQRNHLQ
jgi:hypothetical protein